MQSGGKRGQSCTTRIESADCGRCGDNAERGADAGARRCHLLPGPVCGKHVTTQLRPLAHRPLTCYGDNMETPLTRELDAVMELARLLVEEAAEHLQASDAPLAQSPADGFE